MGKIFEALWVVLFVTWLISTPLMLAGIGAGLAGFYPQEDVYEYNVKAQQVFDTDRVEDSDVTAFENLSADEQELLYRAFKKTDHFMGESEVTVVTDEKLSTFNEWRTIESNGVLLLIAVSEDVRTEPDVDSFKWYHVLLHASMVYWLVGFMFIFATLPH